jgi:outer membrane protein, protease secretion system
MNPTRCPPASRAQAGRPWRNGALALCLAAGWPVWGMDLMTAYQAALAQDATLNAARAAADVSRERLPLARAQLMPNISYSAGKNHNDLTRTLPSPSGGFIETDDNYDSNNQTLQLRQPLFRRPLGVGLAQARSLVASADATLEQEFYSLAQRVVESYLEALLAQDQLELVRKERANTTQQLDAARKAFAAGSGTRTDIDEVRARLDLNTAQELEARQQVVHAGYRMSVLTNRPVTELARLDPARLVLKPPQPAELQDWVVLAEERNPEIRSLRAQVEASRLEVDKANAGHYPTLDLVMQATRSNNENTTAPNTSYDNKLIGVQLNVPLFAGGYVTAQARQATAALARAEAVLEASRRELSLRLHQELRGVTEGVLKVRAMEQAVRSADQRVMSSNRSFEAGSRTMLDILNAEQALQEARRNLARERYLYLGACFRLEALAGGDRTQAIAALNGSLQAEPNN